MIAFALMLAQIAAAEAPDIVVRAKRTREAVDACVARQCPTPDDVRAAMAHAEAQFAQGKYRAARETLRAAIDRQRSAARLFPRSFAALHEASATVSLHIGDVERQRTSVIAYRQTLRDNLPADDPQVMLTTVQLGDFWITRREFDEAKRRYATAERAYAARGDQRLRALCALRIVAVEIVQRRFGEAVRGLKAAAALPAADDPAVRQLRAVLAARLAVARDEEADVGALLAVLRTDPATPPVLVTRGRMTDPINPRTDTATPGVVLLASGEGATQRQWADVGFMVLSDGRVGDVDVLRGGRSQAWLTPYLSEIAGRRYAPLALPSGSPGVYRIERLTLRAEIIEATGSLIRRARGPVSVERLDMTKDAPPVG